MTKQWNGIPAPRASRRYQPMIFALLVTLALAGCGGKDDSTGPPPTGSCCTATGNCTVTTEASCADAWTRGRSCDPSPCGYLPQSSMVNVLANFRTAYENRNLDAYEQLFADDYAFVFSPDDAHDPTNPTPDQWGMLEEFTSARNMFRDELVGRIGIDWAPGAPERADSVMFGPRAWKVKIDHAQLEIHTRNAEGEELIYQMPGATEMFYLREEPSILASDGRPSWFIFRWEDKPVGPKVHGMTWGRIKYIYS